MTKLCQKHENKGLSLLKLGTVHNIPYFLTITGPQGIFGPDNPSEAQLRMIDTLCSLENHVYNRLCFKLVPD